MDKSQTNNKKKKNDEVVGVALHKPTRRNSSSHSSLSGNNNKFVLVAAKPKKATRTTTVTTSKTTMAPRVSRSTAAAAAAASSSSSKGVSSPAVKAKKTIAKTKVVSSPKTASKAKASSKPTPAKKETTKKSIVESDETDKNKKTSTKGTVKEDVVDAKKTKSDEVENTKVAVDTKKSKTTKKTEDVGKGEAEEEKKVADVAPTKTTKKKGTEAATKASEAASGNVKTKGKKSSTESDEKPKDETETKEAKKVVKPVEKDNEKSDEQETTDKTNKKKTMQTSKETDEASKKKTKKETNKDTKDKKDTNEKNDSEQKELASTSTNVQLNTNSERGEQIKKIVVGASKSETKKENEASSSSATSSKPDNKKDPENVTKAKSSSSKPKLDEKEKASPPATEQVVTTKDTTASVPSQAAATTSESVQPKTDSIVIKPLPKVLLELSKAKRKSATSVKKTGKKNKKTSPNRPVNWVEKYITPKPTPTPPTGTPVTLTAAKGTKKKKAKKDPKGGKPSRPLSAYNLFFKEERVKWLAEQKDLSPEALAAAAAAVPTEENADGTVAKAPRALERMAKEIGKRWKALSPEEKQPYVVLAEQEMKRYQGEKVQFVQSKRTSGAGVKNVPTTVFQFGATGTTIGAAPALTAKATKGRKKKSDTAASIGAATAPSFSIPTLPPAVADIGVNAEPLKKKRGRKPKNAPVPPPTTAQLAPHLQPNVEVQPPAKKAKKSNAAARHSTGTALVNANNDVQTAAAARHSIGGTAGLPGDDLRNSFGTGTAATALDANRTTAANLQPLQHPKLNANTNLNGGFYEQQVQQRLQQQALANQQQLRQGTAGNTFGLGANLNAQSNLGVASNGALPMKKPAAAAGMGAPDLLNNQQYNLLGRGSTAADLNVNNLSDAQLELLLERRRLQQNMLYDQLLMGNNTGVADNQSLGVGLGGVGQSAYGGAAGNLTASSIGPNSDLLLNQQGNSSDVQNLLLSQQLRQQELQQQQQLLAARANNARASLDGLSNSTNYNALLQQQELQLEMQLRQRLMMNNQQQLNAASVGRGFGNQNLLNPHHSTDLSPYMMSNNGMMDPQDLRRPSLVSLSTDEGNVGTNPNGLMMNNHGGVNPNSGNNDTLRRLLLAQQQQQQQQQQQLQQGQPYMDNMYNPNPIHYQHGAEY